MEFCDYHNGMFTNTHSNRIDNTMKQSTIQSIAAILTLVATTSVGTICHADNPIIQTKYTADPAPMVYDGTVYVEPLTYNAGGALVKNPLGQGTKQKCSVSIVINTI